MSKQVKLKKLIDGILNTKPFIVYGDYIDNIYCPFCMADSQSDCSMITLDHDENCIYLFARQMNEELDK